MALETEAKAISIGMMDFSNVGEKRTFDLAFLVLFGYEDSGFTCCRGKHCCHQGFLVVSVVVFCSPEEARNDG